MAWAPIKPNVSGAGYHIFRPESYGTPGGIDASVDTPLVQAAFDAAQTHGQPCYVRLNGTYAIEQTADLVNTIGAYSITYGVWLDADYVTLEGGGTLKTLAEQVTTYSYVMLLVGNGGYSQAIEGAFTSWPDIKANGDWTYGNVIQNLTFDNSALDNTAMGNMTTGFTLPGVILLAFCRLFTVTDLTITKTWGLGGIVPHCSSIEYTLKDSTVDQPYLRAVHCDGSEDAVIDNITITNPIELGSGTYGIGMATNNDYEHGAGNNTVKNCNIATSLRGITMNAYDGLNTMSYIQDNTITLPEDTSITRYGISIAVNILTQSWHTQYVSVTGNTINKAGAGTKGWGVYVTGDTTGPTTTKDVEITSNTFGSGLAIALTLGHYAQNNNFHDNTVNCGTTYTKVGGVQGCTGNLVNGAEV